MPGLMAIREEFAPAPAAARRAHRRLAAHDDPDRGADRDAAGARRRGALGLVQHLLDAGSRRRRDRRRAARRCSPTRARRSSSIGNSRTASSNGRTAQHANMILDDGGDATLLLHLGSKAERDASLLQASRERGETALFASIAATLKRDPQWYSTRLAAIRGVTEETTTGVKRLYQMARDGAARIPGHQRQRFGDQEQVRQPVRLPRVAGRWHQARHRRHGRRQGRRRRRLRRRRQGLGAGAAGAVGPGLGHRDRSDLRAAGGDGRLPRRHDGLRLRQGRHLRDRHRQPACAHARAHEAHEEQRDRVQHRPLRQRDRLRLAQASTVGEHQAAGRSHHLPGRQAHHPAGGRPAREPGLRHRASELCHEQLVRQPGAGADRAVEPARPVRRGRARAAEAPRRKGGAAAAGQAQRAS
jgi:hypothetical protein